MKFFLPLFSNLISWNASKELANDIGAIFIEIATCMTDVRMVLWIFPRSITQIDPSSPPCVPHITIRNVDSCRSGILRCKMNLREYILSDRCRSFSLRLVNAVARRNANGEKNWDARWRRIKYDMKDRPMILGIQKKEDSKNSFWSMY